MLIEHNSLFRATEPAIEKSRSRVYITELTLPTFAQACPFARYAHANVFHTCVG